MSCELQASDAKQKENLRLAEGDNGGVQAVDVCVQPIHQHRLGPASAACPQFGPKFWAKLLQLEWPQLEGPVEYDKCASDATPT